MRIVPTRIAAAQRIDRALRDTSRSGESDLAAALATRVWTLRQLTLSASDDDHRGGTPMTPALRALVIDDVIDRLEPGVVELLGPGLGSTGASDAIGNALSEIRQAEIGATEIAAAAGRSPRLRALAALVDAYERALRQRGLIDDAGLIASSTRRIREGAWPDRPVEHLRVEGLYDVTRAQGALLLAIARASGRTTIDIPFDPHLETLSAYAFPYLHMWESVDDPGLEIEIRFASIESAAERAAIIESRDPADEARRVAAWARARADHGTRLEEMAIVLVGGPGPLGSIERELARAGVPFYAHRARRFVDRPGFGILDMPFRLLHDGFRRELLASWVSSPVTTRLDADLLRAAIIGGPPIADGSEPWKRALSGVKGKGAARLNVILDLVATLASREHDPASFWEAYERILVTAGVFEPDGLADLDVDIWDEAIDTVRSALSRLGRWRSISGGWREQRRYLLAALNGAYVSRGRSGRGVTIISARDARGMKFSRMVVVGLSEGAYTKPNRSAAILGDRQRDRINEHLGRRALRTAAEEAREGTLLLLDAIRSTGEEIVLSRAVEDNDGNPQLAANALEEVRDALSLQSSPTRQIDRAVWRIDRSVSSITRAQEAERSRMQFFARPVTGRRGDGDAYSGDLRRALDLLEREASEGRLATWSAGRIDRWRLCPHQFLMSAVLGLESPREGTLETESRVMGTLVHEALQELFREGVDDLDRTRLEHALARAAEALPAAERGDPSIWPLLLDRAVAETDLYLRKYATSGTSDRRPAAFEVEFGFAEEDSLPALELESAGGRRVRLRGRVDRIDVADGGASLHVVDYKFSKPRASHRRAADPGECGVNQFQLWVYFLAALEWSRLSGVEIEPSVTGAIHVVRGPQVYGDVEAPSPERIRGAIGDAIDDAMRGRFDASPEDRDACRYCEFRFGCRIATGIPEGVDDGDDP